MVVVDAVELWATRRVVQAAVGTCEAGIHGRGRSTTCLLPVGNSRSLYLPKMAAVMHRLGRLRLSGPEGAENGRFEESATVLAPVKGMFHPSFSRFAPCSRVP